MPRFETWLRNDLKKMPSVVNLDGVFFAKDSGGNLVGVEVTDNGAPASLTGTVKGYFVLSDGTTLQANGTLSENRASVILPDGAYDVPGPVSIVIKLGDTTVGACTGFIRKSITETII